MKLYWIEWAIPGCENLEAAEKERVRLIETGEIPATAAVYGLNNSTGEIIEAIEALDDMGDPDSLKVLGLIDRLLADDWHGSGVYEVLDEVLKKAEKGAISAIVVNDEDEPSDEEAAELYANGDGGEL